MSDGQQGMIDDDFEMEGHEDAEVGRQTRQALGTGPVSDNPEALAARRLLEAASRRPSTVANLSPFFNHLIPLRNRLPMPISNDERIDNHQLREAFGAVFGRSDEVRGREQREGGGDVEEPGVVEADEELAEEDAAEDDIQEEDMALEEANQRRWQEERQALERLSRRQREAELGVGPTQETRYVSCFAQARIDAQARDDVDTEVRYKQLERNDVWLDDFLTRIAQAAAPVDLDKAESFCPVIFHAFEIHPAFINVEGRVLPVNRLQPASLAPSLFLGSTRRADGRTVTHMTAQIAYMLSADGHIASLFEEALANDGNVSYGTLMGGLQPTHADTVRQPGLYLVNPVANLVYTGMTFSLGIKRRTEGYMASEYGLGKMGIAQTSAPAFPGQIYALMWHEVATAAYPDLVVPAPAVYAAESIVIALTKSWESSLAQVQTAAESGRPQFDQLLLSRPIVGLNTNLFDCAGAFLKQPALSTAGARRLVAILAELERKQEALPVWSPVRRDSTAESLDAEKYLRKTFSTVFPRLTHTSTIYSHIRLRTMITRRALKELPQGTVTGFYIPGKNAVTLIKDLWKGRG